MDKSINKFTIKIPNVKMFASKIPKAVSQAKWRYITEPLKQRGLEQAAKHKIAALFMSKDPKMINYARKEGMKGFRAYNNPVRYGLKSAILAPQRNIAIGTTVGGFALGGHYGKKLADKRYDEKLARAKVKFKSKYAKTTVKQDINKISIPKFIPKMGAKLSAKIGVIGTKVADSAVARPIKNIGARLAAQDALKSQELLRLFDRLTHAKKIEPIHAKQAMILSRLMARSAAWKAKHPIKAAAAFGLGAPLSYGAYAANAGFGRAHEKATHEYKLKRKNLRNKYKNANKSVKSDINKGHIDISGYMEETARKYRHNTEIATIANAILKMHPEYLKMYPGDGVIMNDAKSIFPNMRETVYARIAQCFRNAANEYQEYGPGKHTHILRFHKSVKSDINKVSKQCNAFNKSVGSTLRGAGKAAWTAYKAKKLGAPVATGIATGTYLMGRRAANKNNQRYYSTEEYEGMVGNNNPHAKARSQRYYDGRQ